MRPFSWQVFDKRFAYFRRPYLNGVKKINFHNSGYKNPYFWRNVNFPPWTGSLKINFNNAPIKSDYGEDEKQNP